MEVGGWVQVTQNFCVENRPKIALNQYGYFGVVRCVLCLYINIVKSC